tara:strand:+ start:855 stop:1085 length:231 start_codon:yes stop_codon:yes gene_type:complete
MRQVATSQGQQRMQCRDRPFADIRWDSHRCCAGSPNPSIVTLCCMIWQIEVSNADEASFRCGSANGDFRSLEKWSE